MTDSPRSLDPDHAPSKVAVASGRLTVLTLSTANTGVSGPGGRRSRNRGCPEPSSGTPRVNRVVEQAAITTGHADRGRIASGKRAARPGKTD